MAPEQMGASSRRAAAAEDESDSKRSPLNPARRGGSGHAKTVARNAFIYGFLLLTGYLSGALNYRCAGGGSSPFSKLMAITLHVPSANSHGGGTHATGTSGVAAVRPNPTETPPPSNMTLRFPVCNGFANQRLSVLYGMVLAKRLGRAAVLPVLIDNGLQRSDVSVLANTDNQMLFEDLYDLPYFISQMEAAGMRVVKPGDTPPPSSFTSVVLGGIRGGVIEALRSLYGNVQHLAIDCPLFRLRADELKYEDTDFVWAVLDAMRPNKKAAKVVAKISKAIGATSVPGVEPGGTGGGEAGPAYNYIHLRIENDWVEHCKRWESIPDGVVRDNCYRNTDQVDQQLSLFGVSTDLPLYVATFWEDVEPARRDLVLSRLRTAGYSLVTSADVFPKGGLEGGGREYLAMIEYFIGMRSQRFIGNSVSTFAALGLLERRHRGQWAAHYNGGNIPLASVLPLLHRLPWVFTYNSWSPAYDYMLKGAVRSAAATHSFQPYCMFMGDPNSSIYTWLVTNNVTMITHEPQWREKLVALASRARSNVHHSHLFKTADSLVSTFQRVDLPVVPVLDQYTYVLYTDADVYFRRPIVLDDFGLPLPVSVSMSYEMDNMFPYNAGVIVANLPAMRQRYNAFIAMMLDSNNSDGLYYPNFGPADQGIINKFYERDLRSRMLSQLFNAKPYNPFDANAFIVHFHGPKPHELAAFLESGNCEFKGLCERAFLSGLCKYVAEWSQNVPEESIAVRLKEACSLLGNPVLKRLWSAGGGTRRGLRRI